MSPETALLGSLPFSTMDSSRSRSGGRPVYRAMGGPQLPGNDVWCGRGHGRRAVLPHSSTVRTDLTTAVPGRHRNPSLGDSDGFKSAPPHTCSFPSMPSLLLELPQSPPLEWSFLCYSSKMYYLLYWLFLSWANLQLLGSSETPTVVSPIDRMLCVCTPQQKLPFWLCFKF